MSILHSLLFSIFPILNLYGNNVGEIPFTDILRSFLVSVLLTLLALFVLRLVLRSWEKAGLIWTGILIFVYSYGHLYSQLRTWDLAGFSPGRHRLLLPVWGVIMVVWIWVVGWKIRNLSGLTKFFNIAGLLLMVSPIYSIGSSYITQLSYRQASAVNVTSNPGVQTGSLPDIYYIILDGYGRSDVLDELYGVDNSEFINFLQNQGFYVAENSRSNYNQTVLSLASSLNMEYINYFADTFGIDSKERYELAQMIKKNKIRDIFETYGYQFIAFESGYERTEIRSADHYWSASTDVVPQVTAVWAFNSFESVLLESTAFRALFDLHIFSPESLRNVTINPEYQAHRDRVLYTFARLDDVAEMDGDYFVFAHIISPHPPFVFDANGEPITPENAYRLADGDYYPGSREDYLQKYAGQVKFVNQQIEAVISSILEKSDTPPIIILQGDHGPGAYLVWDSPEKSNLDERLSIFNAYYFPGGETGKLYSSITPVNTFRVILNAFFNGENELLDDKSYFSPWLRPYDFTDVTDRLKN